MNALEYMVAEHRESIRSYGPNCKTFYTLAVLQSAGVQVTRNELNKLVKSGSIRTQIGCGTERHRRYYYI